MFQPILITTHNDMVNAELLQKHCAQFKLSKANATEFHKQ
jgi:hypothetical protein